MKQKIKQFEVNRQYATAVADHLIDNGFEIFGIRQPVKGKSIITFEKHYHFLDVSKKVNKFLKNIQ